MNACFAPETILAACFWSLSFVVLFDQADYCYQVKPIFLEEWGFTVDCILQSLPTGHFCFTLHPSGEQHSNWKTHMILSNVDLFIHALSPPLTHIHTCLSLSIYRKRKKTSTYSVLTLYILRRKLKMYQVNINCAVIGWIMSPQKECTEVPIPSICDCDLILKPNGALWGSKHRSLSVPHFL